VVPDDVGPAIPRATVSCNFCGNGWFSTNGRDSVSGLPRHLEPS
jgi:hypothetical protein